MVYSVFCFYSSPLRGAPLLMRSSVCLCLLSLFSKRDERNIVQRREFAA